MILIETGALREREREGDIKKFLKIKCNTPIFNFFHIKWFILLSLFTTSKTTSAPSYWLREGVVFTPLWKTSFIFSFSFYFNLPPVHWLYGNNISVFVSQSLSCCSQGLQWGVTGLSDSLQKPDRIYFSNPGLTSHWGISGPGQWLDW